MKTSLSLPTAAVRLLRLVFLAFTLILSVAPAARAGLTLDLRLIRNDQGGSYYFYTEISTNDTPPDAPLGNYLFASPQQPTNGTWRQVELTAGGLNFVGGGSSSYNDFDSVMQQITNGNWTLTVTNATTTNHFEFTISAPNVTSNMLPALIVTLPTENAILTTAQPTFTWEWGNIWNVNSDAFVFNNDSSFFQYANLPAAQNNWPVPTLPTGENLHFQVRYSTNSTTAFFTATTPLDTNSAQPISGWVSTSALESGADVNFSVSAPIVAGGHTNLAYYNFENGSIASTDVSGNGNNISRSGSFGVGSGYATNDNFAGGDYAGYFNGSDTSGGFSLNPPTNLLGALAGSFSISLWIQTSQVAGNDSDGGLDNVGLVAAFNGGAKWVVPMALTGSKLAFATGGSPNDTLHSSADINTGDYVHVVVTRNQTTGQKKIYINGVPDASDTGTTDVLDDPYELNIGASNNHGFDGRMDEIQIYSGVLSDSEVLQLYNNPGTAIPDSTGGSSGGLVAHYDFDENTALAADVSGQGNNLVYAGDFGGSGPGTDSDHIGASGGSAYFDGGSFLSAPASLLPTLAGSFTISFWVKTTQNNGDPDSEAWTGDAIISADIPNLSNDLIPAALTGGQVAFNTANTDEDYDDTINSSATVNDGNLWHHVVVSRNQPTGEKFIYIDGVLSASDSDSTNLLNDPQLITIGCKADASNSDPASPSDTGENGYVGLVDDIQIYNRAISAVEVAFLHGHPGEVIAGSDFSAALNTTNLTWTTGGDSPWFTQTTVTHDGTNAARSGPLPLGEYDSSYIQTTVTGPGTLTFWWRNIVGDDNLYTDFYIDGDYQDEIYGDGDWEQGGSYVIGLGTHTLRWESDDDGTSDPNAAGYLDQVSFVPDPPSTNTAPIITVNPINQTNYPGYTVGLYAAATSNPTATWQWFKVGSGPISSATNALYAPINSGTAGVAGSYYAVATNIIGSATTLTAVVTFASAPLPPDWSLAFRPQLNNDFSEATTNYNIACLLDSTGTNIYTVGSIQGTNTFGPDTLISGNGRSGSMFLKQTTTGTPIWGRAMTNDGNGSSYAQSVVAAPGDGIYVSGKISGTNWLGTNQLVDTAGGSTYLARFDANGSNLWVRLITGTNFNFTTYHMLASDPDGNVTLSALIWGDTSFGTTNVFADGQRGVLVQYDADGNVRWLQMPSGWPESLVYNAGRIYGSMGGDSTSYIGGVTNVSDRRHALFSLNATNGQGYWVKGVAAQQDQGPPVFGNDDVLVAVSGTNVFLAGSAWGSNAVFGPFTIHFPNSEGQYFARYDTDGNAQLATAFGSPYTWLWAIKANAAGDAVYIGGDFDTYSVFGNNVIAAPFYDTVQSVGGIENRIPGQTFVAKFDRDGNPLWARPAHSDSSYLNSRDLAVAPDGIWSCGFFNPIGVFGTNTVYGGITVIGSVIEYHSSGYLAKITDGVSTAMPVTLLNSMNNGANFQFQFLSQSGFTHNILYRTNLSVGNWKTNSTVTGNGTITNISLPFSLFGPAGQGFIRVTTQ